MQAFIETPGGESSALSLRFQAEIERYDTGTQGQWITIGGAAADGKKHAGGTPVKVDGSGRIAAGPAGLKGKPISHIDRNKQPEGKPTPPAAKSLADNPVAKSMSEHMAAHLRKSGRPEPAAPFALKPGTERPSTPQAKQAALFDKKADGVPTQRPAPRPGPAVLSVDDIHADPSRFQYKVSGIDPKTGVTKALEGVSHYNPMLGNGMLVWHDPADGKTYVINGHHRLHLANRAGYHGTTGVFYIDAKDEKEARALGAIANIAGGNGTAVDAAKFLRDTGTTVEGMKQHGISLKGKIAADGAVLSNLDGDMFRDLTMGKLDEQRALAIGRHVSKPEFQKKLHGAILKREEKTGRSLPNNVVEELAREMELAGSRTEKGSDLFGDFENEKTNFFERGEIKAAVRKQLGEEKNAFRAVSNKKRVGRLEDAGNQLDVEGNARRAQSASEALGMFDKLVNTKGPLSDAVNAAAEAYGTNPKAKRRILSDAYKTVLDAIRREFGGEGMDASEDDTGATGEAVEARGGNATERFYRDAVADRFAVELYSRLAGDSMIVLESGSTAKQSKQAAGYRPAPGSARCELCEHYRSERCALVDGDIRAADFCDLFQWDKTPEHYAKRPASSPGQVGMFDESKHPRDDDGKFARTQAAQAAMKGKAAHEVPASVHADAQGKFDDAGRAAVFDLHRNAVIRAARAGKQVPDHVIAEHPDLAKLMPGSAPQQPAAQPTAPKAAAKEKKPTTQRPSWGEQQDAKEDAADLAETKRLSAQPNPMTAQMNEAFKLANAPVKPQPLAFDNLGGKQQALFGKSGKPGQMNLFADTGVPDELVAGFKLAVKEHYALPGSPSIGHVHFEENKHPRATDGRFGSVSGSHHGQQTAPTAPHAATHATQPTVAKQNFATGMKGPAPVAAPSAEVNKRHPTVVNKPKLTHRQRRQIPLASAPLETKTAASPEQIIPKLADRTTRYLKPEHQKSLADYTLHDKALPLNAALRTTPDGSSLTPEQRQFYGQLKEAVKAANGLPEPVTLHRGVGAKYGAVLLQHAQDALNGSRVIEGRGMASHSLDSRKSVMYAGGSGGVMLRVRAKTGAYLEPITHAPDEQEVLHPHGKRYYVHGISTEKMSDPDGNMHDMRVIHLEELV